MPNHRSIHAGGILIGEEPLTYYTALDLPPKGFPTVQWDMYEAEAIGLDKYDILYFSRVADCLLTCRLQFI